MPNDSTLNLFTINQEGYRNQSHARYLEDYTLLKLEEKSFQKIKSRRNTTVSLGLPYKTGSLQLELEPLNLFDGEFKLITDKSNGQALPFKPGTFYRGKIKDDTASMVTLSVFDDEVSGIISSTRFGNLNLGRIQNQQDGGYILYNESDAKENISFTCASPTNAIYRSQLEQIQTQIEQQLESRADGCITVDFELTHEVYTQYQNNINNAANWLTTLFAAVKSLYLNEQVNISIKTIFVWTSDDGYSDDVGTALDQLKSRRLNDAAFTANFVHLVRGELCNGGCSLAGIAWLDILCNSSYRFAVSEPLFSYAAYPGYSWSVNVLTHEQGHNIASPHTHWCGWTGGPIDGCASPDGTCTAGPIPASGGGTIMSYCHQNVGINFANGFGPQPGTRIRARYNAATCLSTSCNDGITVPAGPTNCNDGIQNGSETGIDCGGSCGACVVACGAVVNLSQGKPASQSSTYNASTGASKVNDGDLNSINHTTSELQPWWQVDLGANYTISSIEIKNRTDCCGNRIRRFRLFISNSPVGTYQTSGSVYTFDNPAGLANGQLFYISNLSSTGRYVRIWVDNTGYGNNYLHLGEVRVFGCTSGPDPCLANSNPMVGLSPVSTSFPREGSITISASASDPGGSISKVEFYNNNVLIGTDLTTPYEQTIIPASLPAYDLTAKAYDNCNGLTTSDHLVINTTISCNDGIRNGDEIGVDCGGSNCAPCESGCASPINLSQGKPASQSSSYNASTGASKVNDGDVNSINHSLLELQPWWQVDLQNSYSITSIEITNRGDCCGNRIKRFRVFISNTPVGGYNTTGSVYEYNNPSGLSNGQVINISGLTASGRYVRIWVDNTGYGNNYLHLGEVRVFGCTSGPDPCLANSNPIVGLSSLSTSFPSEGSFTIRASASDPGGSISKVEFYNNNVLIGTDLTTPYEQTITPASLPAYDLTAKAYDNCNGMTTSDHLLINTTINCNDGIRNGDEIGVDCGGSNCTPCESGCASPINLSQGKPASQSSSYNASTGASKVNDGDVNSINHSLLELQPWWQVDLQNSYSITSIEITNRGDCCGNRIKRFRVFISNTPVGGYNTTGSVYEYNNPSGLSNGQVINISGLTASGRYVRIWVDNTGYGNNYMHLAEVKVMGCNVSGIFFDSTQKNFMVNLYPNPVRQVLNFNFSVQTLDGVKAQIFDVFGRLQLEEMVVNGSLDIGRLENGGYFVHILYQDERKVIKILKY